MKIVRTVSVVLGLVMAVACASCGSAETDHGESAVIAAETVQTHELGAIGNLHAFGGILTAGQPSADDFEEARKAGVATVVNMRHEREMKGFDEAALMADLGITYVAMPWNGADELTDEIFDRSREILNTAEQPLMVHCGSANRVGAVWIPWRVLDGGISFEEALAEAKTIGLRTPAYAPKARDYIERHR